MDCCEWIVGTVPRSFRPRWLCPCLTKACRPRLVVSFTTNDHCVSCPNSNKHRAFKIVTRLANTEPQALLRRGRERPRHVIPSGGPSAPGRRLSSRPQGQGRLFSGKGCCAKKRGAQQLLCCCRLDCGIAMYNIQHPIHGKKKRSKSIARRLHGLCRGAPRFKQRRGICAQGMERHEGYGHRCSSHQGSHNCMGSEFQGCGCTRCG